VWDKIGARFTGVSQRREEELAATYVEQLGIRLASAEQLVGELSGGNQQKVVIGKWLATRPKIIILDEPTKGIDVGSKASVHAFIGELVGQGVSVILVSSELPELLRCCDRVLVMHEGRQAGIVEVTDTSQEEILALATGVRVEDVGSS